MIEQALSFLEHAGMAISLFALLAIVVGFALALLRFTRHLRALPAEENFKAFKIGLGRTLTLGLEILVVADVIETITVKPTVGTLAFLGVLVALRTIVSWTLTVEIEGRWPWQAPREDPDHA